MSASFEGALARFAWEMKGHVREARTAHPAFGGILCVAREFADLVKADEAVDPVDVRRQCLHLAAVACRLAIQSAATAEMEEESKAAIRSLEEIPYWQRTPELCMEHVARDGGQLRFVPSEIKTPAMCMEAVKNRGAALEHVPYAMRREPICLMAVEQDGMALDFVPHPYRMPSMCLAAVRQNGMALQLAPDGSKTEDVCLAALKADLRALSFVPRQMRTELLAQAGVDL